MSAPTPATPSGSSPPTRDNDAPNHAAQTQPTPPSSSSPPPAPAPAPTTPAPPPQITTYRFEVPLTSGTNFINFQTLVDEEVKRKGLTSFTATTDADEDMEKDSIGSSSSSSGSSSDDEDGDGDVDMKGNEPGPPKGEGAPGSGSEGKEKEKEKEKEKGKEKGKEKDKGMAQGKRDLLSRMLGDTAIDSHVAAPSQPRNRLTEVINRIERFYQPRSKEEVYGYDSDDSLIDNSEITEGFESTGDTADTDEGEGGGNFFVQGGGVTHARTEKKSERTRKRKTFPDEDVFQTLPTKPKKDKDTTHKDKKQQPQEKAKDTEKRKKTHKEGADGGDKDKTKVKGTEKEKPKDKDAKKKRTNGPTTLPSTSSPSASSGASTPVPATTPTHASTSTTSTSTSTPTPASSSSFVFTPELEEAFKEFETVVQSVDIKGKRVPKEVGPALGQVSRVARASHPRGWLANEVLERLAKVLPVEAATIKLHIKKYEEQSKEDQWSAALTPLEADYEKSLKRLTELVGPAVVIQERENQAAAARALASGAAPSSAAPLDTSSSSVSHPPASLDSAPAPVAPSSDIQVAAPATELNQTPSGPAAITSSPSSSTPSSDVLSSTSQPVPVEATSSSATTTTPAPVPTPSEPAKPKFRWTMEMKDLVYNLVHLHSSISEKRNERLQATKKPGEEPELVSRKKERDAVYLELIKIWPPGWMDREELAKVYTARNAAVKKKENAKNKVMASPTAGATPTPSEPKVTKKKTDEQKKATTPTLPPKSSLKKPPAMPLAPAPVPPFQPLIPVMSTTHIPQPPPSNTNITHAPLPHERPLLPSQPQYVPQTSTTNQTPFTLQHSSPPPVIPAPVYAPPGIASTSPVLVPTPIHTPASLAVPAPSLPQISESTSTVPVLLNTPR
eukprot:TRINITY_DN2812_c0_g1_i2.p1 TRINITY_DN2812_c0_g1~~TRINITY_DN2812_c0_g1_i2.p1  ORF type:complete len:900 (-),score=329.31 TRINITY_DN2812_c0_g1_i2:965-3664(-)